MFLKLFLSFIIFTLLGGLSEYLSRRWEKLAPYFIVLAGLFLIIAASIAAILIFGSIK